MKKHHIDSVSAVCLTAATLLWVSTTSAEPITCNNDDFPIINQVIFDSAGGVPGSISDYVEFHQEHFIFEPDNGLVGIEEDLFRDVSKHMVASMLITRGVGGTPPAPEQDANGAWFLPQPLAASPFHRSSDEWGPMSGGWGPQGMSQVDGNGVVQPGDRFHGGHRSRKAGEPLWGVAQNRPFPDLDSLPDRALEYDCECFDDAVFAIDSSGNRSTVIKGADAVSFARTIVHESWHSIGLGHSNSDLAPVTSNQCNQASPGTPPQPQPVCNVFVPRAPGSHSGELVERNEGPFFPQNGPGSYQLAEEFTCDLALHAADWVPLMVSLVADFDHDDFLDRDYYTNIDRLNNAGPFACDDVAHEAFLEASELGTCDGEGNVCRDDADCDQSSGPQICTPPGGGSCQTQACLASVDCQDPFNTCLNNCCITVK